MGRAKLGAAKRSNMTIRMNTLERVLLTRLAAYLKCSNAKVWRIALEELAKKEKIL